jgi:hypothetical protein
MLHTRKYLQIFSANIARIRKRVFLRAIAIWRKSSRILRTKKTVLQSERLKKTMKLFFMTP